MTEKQGTGSGEPEAGKGEKGMGNQLRERKHEKWEQKRELEMKLLKGLGLFKLGFVPIFHFPVPRFSNVLNRVTLLIGKCNVITVTG